jgi:hypothetical protein
LEVNLSFSVVVDWRIIWQVFWRDIWQFLANCLAIFDPAGCDLANYFADFLASYFAILWRIILQ